MFAQGAVQPGEWTAADVLYQGRSARLVRRDAQNLVNRALALANASINANANAGASASSSPSASPSPAAKATGEAAEPPLRLQLQDQNNPEPVAQFELRGNAFRWQRAGQADVLGVLTPEAAAGLLAEAARALPP